VLRSTETGEQAAQGGDFFAPKGTPPPAAPAPTPPPAADFAIPGKSQAEERSTDLDFLYDASAVLVNLVPDKDGVVKLTRKEIGPHAMIHVVAVDPLSTTYRSTTLPEQKASFVDLRLRNGLDPEAHFSQQKQVTTLTKDRPFVLADAAGSRFEVYDSLAKVYSLYSTLTNDPKLAEFSFILNWPKLKPEEKQTLYSKFACHELNFFLLKKDQPFFLTVVRPYLANKKDKTFLDHWLLNDDLREFTQPWQFGRLNSVERVLLAQKLAGEPAKTARTLKELLSLQPPNTERGRMLFETAVKGSALTTAEAWGRLPERERMLKLDDKQKAHEEMPKDMPAKSEPADDRMTLEGGATGKPNSNAPAGRPGMPGGGAGGARFKNGDGKGKELAEFEALRDTDKEEKFFEDDRKKSKMPSQLYRKVDATQEWAENNYYHLPIAQQLAGLVPISDFWYDYARHDGRAPFLSQYLADASKNFTEMMFAISVLDLPFAAGKHEVKFDRGQMTFAAANTAVAFHEEVRATGPAAGNVQILVSQNFYRQGDRYRDENGERFDKFITNEFVIHTVYGGQVVVTNPSPSRQKLAVLIQIPVGAIPVGNGQNTKSVMLDLEPYHTQTIDFLFYFPKAGKFSHFPVHVAKAEALVASAQPFVFNVVEKPSKLDTESWDYISQNGTTEQVLAYMSRENVHALDLEKIAFRMKDKTFFGTAIQLLQERHVYQPTLWSYGIYHNVPQTAREFLMHADQVVAECAGPINCSLLVIDPVARHQYEHLEYKPLVNARAHSLGKRRQIVNNRFDEQYHKFMKLLSYRSQLTDDDLLAVTHYLMLQDRIEDALRFFDLVKPDRIATRMQYDFCAAYLDMSTEEPQKARAVATKYAGHPVERWRNTFASLANQLDEIDGKGPKVADADNRDQRQNDLAAHEPGVEFTIDAKTINMTWQNVDSARVNYYLMDVELLFSRNPFVQQSGGQFSSIKPNFTQDVKFPEKDKTLALKLPDNLLKRNVLVEISAGGKTRSQPYYANAMDVKMNENYGQLRVTDGVSGKALAKVYVKTYVHLSDGTVKFYKDGYTDLRGRFDYASVSTPEKAPITKFAILVLSDEHGALIREANPPQQ
jgi:hypothetical protein